MRKNLIFIVSLILIVISMCGCATKTVEVEVSPIEMPNLEEKETEIKNNSAFKMNAKSGDDYQTIVTKIDSGTRYSIIEEDFKAKMLIGDNYYATQLSDIAVNFNSYSGDTIEIEGFSLANDYGYTFVGRYSESVICPDCPTGYAYLEYEWHGDEKLDLGTETTWIKVKGQLKKGFDEMYEYYYIDAYSIEVMDEWGMATVIN